jgi:signal transduction histidine kinase
MQTRQGEPAVRLLLEEQAALRRVATLVAVTAEPARVFLTVTEEVGRLLHAETANMVRYNHDGTAYVIGAWCTPGMPSVELGSTIRLDGETLTPKIERSGRPERVDSYDGLDGTLAARLRKLGLKAGVGAPIVLDGELWGAVVVSSVEKPFPAGDEHRIAAFTELVAHALAGAETRTELTASRARIVSAGDAARRRLERNLHDGAQQRLVALAIALRIIDRLVDQDPAAAHRELSRAGEELAEALAELREIARGLHPAILTDHGLLMALEGLRQRTPVPVDLTFEVPDRPSGGVEAAAYYVVAEALTNIAKYARATSARVEVRALGDRLLVEVADDGVGGADHREGSGLRGLADRVESLGGRLYVQSAPGAGTSIRADFPASPATRNPGA